MKGPDRVQLQAAVGLDGAHGLPGYVLDQVHVAGLQRGGAQVLVGIDHHADGLDLRQSLPVVRHRFQCHGAATLLFRHAKWASADWIARIRFGPDQSHVVAREPFRERGNRFLGIETHGVRVRRLDLRHALELGAHVGGRFLAGDLLDVPSDIVGRHRLAILEPGILSQLEDPGAIRRVARPGFRQLPA
jgi:hypothetical protein